MNTELSIARMLESRHGRQPDPFSCQTLVDWSDIQAYHLLLAREFMSVGGPIRDISLQELYHFRQHGFILAAKKEEKIIAGMTVEPITGLHDTWWYVNRGITHESFRRQGVAERLLATIAHTMLPRAPLFVLTISEHPFFQNGFTRIALGDLMLRDPIIGTIVSGKIRKDHEASLLVRIARSAL